MKRNIALVWGGYSSEIVVSEKSAAGLDSFFDKTKYDVYKVKITKDSWTAQSADKEYAIDKNDFSFFDTLNNKKVQLEFAYITIHGTPGEDGHLQGYFDLLDIPYSSCGVMASSLTMNKYICNKYLSHFGFRVAQAARIKKGDTYSVQQIVEQLGLPMFVKPNNGGSSFATTKVKTIEALQPAIDAAFAESNDVIVESYMAGTEVTNGCYKVGVQKHVLPITEVVTKNEFFDYGAKYQGEVDEITPARISDSMTQQIKELTLRIYDLIDAKGIVRVDYIISPDNIPYLLEINTTPGMTTTSFIPQQVVADGKTMTEVLSQIVENEFK